MKLFFTDSTCSIGGIPRPSIPFLCDAQMELVRAPNEYLRYIATVRGRTRSEKTWRTYGSNLLEYFAFLEANGLAWDTASQGQIAAWRDAMLERGCGRSTVNQRLRSVHAFYDWAVKSGTAAAVPFDKQDIGVAKPPGFLAHVNAKGGHLEVNSLTLKTYEHRPQFLLLEKAIRFLEEASPRRLQLMGYLMLLTGMRREEVTALDYRVVPNPAGRDPGKQIPMVLDATITPTKGEKTRTVMLPYDLAVALHAYFTFEWPKLLILHKKKYKAETTLFFLSRTGDPLSIKGVNNAFARVSIKTGITCHPHLLRHTYGTYELLRMLRTKGESQALLWVKDRMGHSSITTTEQYIHAADLIQHDAIDGYIADVCRAIRHGH